MNIRFRITILFTLVVTSILLIVCMSIYYFSDLNRKKDFNKRLRNRALTSVRLLSNVKEIDNNLLRKIDETTVITIQDKSIVIYDYNKKEVYRYSDSNVVPLTVPSAILDEANARGEYYFSDGIRQGLVLYHRGKEKAYTAVVAAYDKDGLEKLIQLRFILLVSFISGTLITFITGLVFSAGIVLPIKKIISEVKEISSQHLSRRIQVKESRDELGQLADTFNDLLTRLQKSFEIQGRFIANASHELSTPLTSISSQLEITLQSERDSSEYKEVLRSVYDDVKNLNQLTRSLLEIAKASGTSDGIELTLVRMDELIMKLTAELHKTDRLFIINLHFDSFPEAEDKLFVFGNIDLLYSSVKNIVFNACKFGIRNEANVILNFTDDYLDVVVENQGPEIPEAEKEMIFQPFYRGKSSSESGGFGLGLSLASRIIKLHKGEIILDSPVPGTTRFTIRLPIARKFHTI